MHDYDDCTVYARLWTGRALIYGGLQFVIIIIIKPTYECLLGLEANDDGVDYNERADEDAEGNALDHGANEVGRHVLLDVLIIQVDDVVKVLLRPLFRLEDVLQWHALRQLRHIEQQDCRTVFRIVSFYNTTALIIISKHCFTFRYFRLSDQKGLPVYDRE